MNAFSSSTYESVSDFEANLVSLGVPDSQSYIVTPCFKKEKKKKIGGSVYVSLKYEIKSYGQKSHRQLPAAEELVCLLRTSERWGYSVL